MVKHVALESDGKISGKKWLADHTGDLTPDVDNTQDLGSAALKWNNCYVKNYIDETLTLLKARTLFLKFPDGKGYTPGDTDAHSIDACKTKVAADYLEPTYWRLTCYAGGDENTGSNKTVTVTNATSSLSVEWTALGDDLRVSAWTEWDSTLTDQVLQVSYKAGSNTETLTLYNIGVEFRFG